MTYNLSGVCWCWGELGWGRSGRISRRLNMLYNNNNNKEDKE